VGPARPAEPTTSRTATSRPIMSVNLDGVFYSMRAELPAIAAAGYTAR
jgi:hypothetical protein